MRVRPTIRPHRRQLVQAGVSAKWTCLTQRRVIKVLGPIAHRHRVRKARPLGNRQLSLRRHFLCGLQRVCRCALRISQARPFSKYRALHRRLYHRASAPLWRALRDVVRLLRPFYHTRGLLSGRVSCARALFAVGVVFLATAELLAPRPGIASPGRGTDFRATKRLFPGVRRVRVSCDSERASRRAQSIRLVRREWSCSA